MYRYWLVWRYLLKGKQWRAPSTLLSLIGLMLGVACLVVAMAVVTGFRSTLEKTVIDVLGHMSVTKGGVFSEDEILTQVQPLLGAKSVAAPFVNLKAIYASKGRVQGVVIEGVNLKQLKKVTRLENLLVEGKFDVSSTAEGPGVLVGRELFREAGLKVGDVIRLVIPLAGTVDSTDFRSKLMRFQVRGVLHFGHYEFDSRYIITDLKTAQRFGEVGDRISGVRYKLADAAAAFEAKTKIQSELGSVYQVDTWWDYNRNLFEAAELEKIVIFFVLLVIIVAAAFNVSATLFVFVVRRYQDISILKTIGASSKDIRKIFIFLGLAIGCIGSFAGLLLGYILCLLFEFSQHKWSLILGSIYKIDHIDFEISFFDATTILICSLLICLVATLAPAARGSRLSPVEGLRYD